MKNLTLKTIAGCVLAGSAMFAGSAMASPVITNTTGSFGNFGGFDYAANGTAVAVGFDPTINGSDNFVFSYWASAAQVVNLQGQGGLGSGFAAVNGAILSGAYEYTVKVTLNETSTCTAYIAGNCTAATFAVSSGVFSIYYDTVVNANQQTGVGFDDGALLLSGFVAPTPSGGFDVINGGNGIQLFGVVTNTNNAFINPDLQGTTAVSTLQIDHLGSASPVRKNKIVAAVYRRVEPNCYGGAVRGIIEAAKVLP